MTHHTDSADLRAIKAAIENDDVPGFGAMIQTMDQAELESVAQEIRYKLGDDLRPMRKLFLELINDQIARRKKERN